MTTAFGYVRASTQEEVKQGSNERQKEILVNFFKAKGWDYQIYEDRGKTGANMERDGFKRMLDDIEKEKPYAVVVAKIDRYGGRHSYGINSIFTRIRRTHMAHQV